MFQTVHSQSRFRFTNTWAVACDFQQCGILTSVGSDKPVQLPFKLRNSKWCSVSSLTIIECSSDKQMLWSDCAYAQADLRLTTLLAISCNGSHKALFSWRYFAHLCPHLKRNISEMSHLWKRLFCYRVLIEPFALISYAQNLTLRPIQRGQIIPILPYFVHVTRECSCVTARKCRLVRVFAARQCDKYQKLMLWPKRFL